MPRRISPLFELLSHGVHITFMSRLFILILSLLLSHFAGAAQQELKLENSALEISLASDTGRISVSSKSTHHLFLRDVTLTDTNGIAKSIPVADKTFGPGQSIEISYPNGNQDRITLFPSLPFALFRSSVHNTNAAPVITRKITTLSGTVNVGKDVANLKTFGTGGLLAPEKNPGSYAWLAIAEPQTRNGAVFGWLTHDRGSGVLFTKIESGALRAEARIDYGHLRTAPGKTSELETLAIGYFDDARLGLEAWADAVARVYDIHLPPQPAGYCTWYSQPHGGSSDEKHLAEQAKFAATNLAPFGFSVIQIDDHWQDGISTNGPKRNFTTHKPDGPYPAGMKAAADQIKSLGLTPGIWFMPFAGTYYDPFFKDHPDWFVKNEAGLPYETAWGGTCLDMTNPEAREHLRDTVRRLADDWGFTYFKMDGLWTGTGTKQQYVNSGYKDDNIGDAVFHDSYKPNLEAYRDGLRLVRDTVGRKVFILGCNGPQNMRSYGGAFGLVDGMRIGPDNKSDWKNLQRGPLFGSRHYFLHGRIWYNDPDPVYVRESMPLNHARLICSWVTLSGQLNLSSEWFPGLPADRLDILKRTMPSHGLMPRPADLFERELPSLWLLSDTRRSPRRDVIGVFNWESTEQKFDYPLDRLGLDPQTDYVAFDYWQNTPVPSIKGRLQLPVAAESCRILAVRPRVAHPQLLSTSRHITQGIVDVLEETWDEKTRTLSGCSKVVGGDTYELRILADSHAGSFNVSRPDETAGVLSSSTESTGLLRVRLRSPVSREVSWHVKFDP